MEEGVAQQQGILYFYPAWKSAKEGRERAVDARPVEDKVESAPELAHVGVDDDRRTHDVEHDLDKPAPAPSSWPASGDSKRKG